MSHPIIEQLKLVLGAEGWKAFMAELAAARGRARDVVVRRWLAVVETMRAEKLAELKRAEAKAKADAEEFNAIGAIVDPYQRANPELTIEEPELPHSDGHNVRPKPTPRGAKYRNVPSSVGGDRV